MRCSFVAVVSHAGLESLLPECQGAMCWAQRVAENRPAVGLWAVMERGSAAEISDLLLAGEGHFALNVLAFTAEFMGPLPLAGNASIRGTRS